MNQLFWIALGGALGAVLRYLMVLGIGNLFPLQFPLGTLLVNLLGCFAIGLVFALWGAAANFQESIRPFLVVGVLGGFTTFSAYSFEMVEFIRQAQMGKALLYFLGSNALGILAAFAGYKLFEA